MITPAHRRRLNAAMHELRRPLQAMALGNPSGANSDPPGRGLLEMASAALADLEVEVNGGLRDAAGEARIVRGRDLVQAAVVRRSAAGAWPETILRWDAGTAEMSCDPVRVARALDNLLANAIEHGVPPLVVNGARVEGRIRITIANGARPAARRDPADPRHGHGLAIVSAIAAEHGGRFAFCRTGSGFVAALELPLLGGDLVRAA